MAAVAAGRAHRGFDQEKFMEDIRNAIDDYIADGLDALETQLLQEIAKAGADGCDSLVTDLRKVFDEKMDLMEMYTERNVFRVPDGVEMGSGREAAGDGEQEEEEEDDDDDDGPDAAAEEAVLKEVEEAKQAIADALRRRRTLRYLKRLFEKQMPQYRSAVEGMGSAASRVAGAPVDATLSDLSERATRLQGLCTQLLGSPPSARASSVGGAGRRRSSIGGTAARVTAAHAGAASRVGGARLQDLEEAGNMFE